VLYEGTYSAPPRTRGTIFLRVTTHQELEQDAGAHISTIALAAAIIVGRHPREACTQDTVLRIENSMRSGAHLVTSEAAALATRLYHAARPWGGPSHTISRTGAASISRIIRNREAARQAKKEGEAWERETTIANPPCPTPLHEHSSPLKVWQTSSAGRCKHDRTQGDDHGRRLHTEIHHGEAAVRRDTSAGQRVESA